MCLRRGRVSGVIKARERSETRRSCEREVGRSVVCARLGGRSEAVRRGLQGGVNQDGFRWLREC
jgi:hypothetical protein